MRPTALRIAAADGYSLGATLFAPDAPNGRVVVLNAAMGVKRGFYAPFALHLAARGFTAVTYDYRGIGDSRPPSSACGASDISVSSGRAMRPRFGPTLPPG